MKQKIRFVDHISGKVTVTEKEIRNLDHFEVQLHTRMHIEKPKKGKGSFKRNKRVSEDD